MTLQNIAGGGLWIPRPGLAPMTLTSSPPTFGSSIIISANASAKVAMCGRMWNKDHATKNIQKIGFRFGGIVKSNAFTVQVSVQGVSTANGPPIQPDGTILGASNNAKTTFTDATSGVTSNTWFDTAALTALPSVTYGQMISIVWEWTSAGTTNSVNIAGLIGANAEHQAQFVSTTDGTTWSSSSTIPDVILAFDDGAFGTLDGGLIASTTTATAYQTGDNPNELGLVFQLPGPAKIDGCWILFSASNTSAAALTAELTDSTGAVVNSCSQTIDCHQVTAIGATRLVFIPLPETSLSANTDYYLGFKSTTSTTLTLSSLTVNAAGHLDTMEGGQNFRYSTRNGGSWAAATTTRRLFAGIRLSAIDGGGGGGVAKFAGDGGGFAG